MQRRTLPPGTSPRLALGLVLAAAACTPRDFDDTTSTVLTDSDSTTTTSTSTGPTSLGTTTSTVTTADASGTDASSSTTGSDTEGTSSSTTGDLPPCDHDLMCDVDEDATGCLHDCGGCEPDGVCDAAAETPFSCPVDCDASACNHDGLVDALSEQCDDGNDANDDACTDTCSHNVCGDGFLFAGAEECDDGNADDGDGCSSKCVRDHRVVFVTSAEYKGNLLPAIDNLSGLALADAHCQQLADAGDLPGGYMAWLSTGVSAPSERFNVMAGFAGRYELLDGTAVAESWDDFTGATLLHAIDRDEQGAQVSSLVWTNTATNGNSKGSFDCDGWSSSDVSSKGGYGSSQYANKQWTDVDVGPCGFSARLYCVQVTE
ncbi:MAG: DUF4215 domain-containing protein [Myxococcales bacterium]|nr:DUF4215 domain-containing protein [Myxococcales bacterium]